MTPPLNEPSCRRVPCGICGQAGFTLIEVLLAMLLVAVVLPVSMQAIDAAMRLSGVADDRQIALSLAETKMQDVLMQQEWTNPVARGDFNESSMREEDRLYPEITPKDPKNWRWELDVDTWDDLSTTEVKLVVLWDRYGRTHHVTLATVVQTYGGL